MTFTADMDHRDVLAWLKSAPGFESDRLFKWADETRQKEVGTAVFLRGLIEISNYCSRHCLYCGLRAPNHHLSRYRMTSDEIMESVRLARSLGYGTVVLQGGEDEGLTRDFISALIRRIKEEVGLAVTLSLGERKSEDYLAWKQAGADRYLLRFETSDIDLYSMLHPAQQDKEAHRLTVVRSLSAMGFETGSGVMVGLPGQSFQSLSEDLLLFRELNLDMIGVGPYIPHPETPLLQDLLHAQAAADPVPATMEMALKVIALARLLCPQANIPATTALATLSPESGYRLGLQCGANVLMPNLTPMTYRVKYEIYPEKASLKAVDAEYDATIDRLIHSLGRKVGEGVGQSGAFQQRSRL